MSKKLAAKAGLIQVPPAGGLPPAAKPVGDTRPKTAPGAMLHFMSTQSTAVEEAEELRDRLKAFEGAAAVRAIDPRLIRASKWANRHEASFSSAAFVQHKAEIAEAGGNVQPIRVRPLPKAAPNATAVGEHLYELVYGHRRHRACLELGIPVNALIEDATDQELFEAMERENRGRENLSAWEQGSMYRKALDEGLYSSMRKLAEAVGVDVSLVSKSVTLARLPDAVVAAFPSPLDIQFRWAQPLAESLQKDPEGTLARAKAVKSNGKNWQASQVFAALIGGEGVLNGSTSRPAVEVQVGGKRAATIEEDRKGRVFVRFERDALPVEKRSELAKLLETLLARA